MKETVGRLRGLAIFAKVVEQGSFTAAADRLGIGKSAVSKQVRALEADLGVRLVNRSTRSVAPTDAGQQLYARCVRMLEEAEDGCRVAAEQRDLPSGRMRVAAPVEFGRTVLLPVIRDLLAEHPTLDAQVLLDDRHVDLVERGVDVAFRIGFFKDSTFVQRRLATLRYGLFAAPGYVRARGAPKTPQQAAALDWILLSFLERPDEWSFRRGAETTSVAIRARMMADNTVTPRQLAVLGAGVAPLLIRMASDDVAAGRLQRVLPEYELEPEVGLFAVYPHRAFPPARLTLLVERLAAHFAA